MGATRAVRVVILVAGVLGVVDLGELIQAFEQVRDLQRADRVSRLIEYQQDPRPARQVSLGMVPQSEVPNLVKTTREDVL